MLAQGKITSDDIIKPREDQLLVIKEGKEDDEWSDCDELDTAAAAEMELNTLKYNDEVLYWEGLDKMADAMNQRDMFNQVSERAITVNKTGPFFVTLTWLIYKKNTASLFFTQTYNALHTNALSLSTKSRRLRMHPIFVDNEVYNATGHGLQDIKATNIFTASEMLVSFLVNNFRYSRRFHR